MRQKRSVPKYQWHGNLTLANYDFLAVKSIREGVSMAVILNQILEQIRLNSTANCNFQPERIGVNYDGRRGYAERHISV
jgi:hypothetical protein